MSKLELDAIEYSITRAKKAVALGTAFDRLQDNKDFKAVILDGYFRDEAVRLVHAKADPSMQQAESQKSILSQIDSIGSLFAYFTTINQFSNLALKEIEEAESAREEILSEGA